MSRSHTSLLRDAASGAVCKLPPEACYRFNLAKMFVSFAFAARYASYSPIQSTVKYIH